MIMNTHITVRPHVYAFEKNPNKRFKDQRVCLYLEKEDNSFVDSLDIDYDTGKIRFYRYTKHLSRIPQFKKKLWNCKNFKKMIIEHLQKAIDELSKDSIHKEMYEATLQSIKGEH